MIKSQTNDKDQMATNNSAANFKPQPVKEIFIPTDKLLTFLNNEGCLDEAVMFEKTTKTGKGKQSKRLEVNSTIDLKVTNGGVIEQFDRAVLMAFCNFQSAGNKFITLRRICKYLGGSATHANTKFAKAVMASIEKLRHTDFSIDMAAYLKNCTDTPDLKLDCRKTCYLLPATIHAANYHCGEKYNSAVVIELTGKIPILEVSDVKNQIARLPLELIQGLKWRTNENSIAVAWYLLERITKVVGSHSHKRTRKLQPTICLETLLTDCNLTGLDKHQRHDLFAKIKNILNHFKEKGFIDNFSFDKSVNEISAITFTFKKNPANS